MNYENRSQVPEKYKWDLSVRYKNDDLWYKDYENIKTKLILGSNCKGKVLSTPETLFEVLEIMFGISKAIDKLYCYANSKLDENIENNKYSLMLEEVTTLHYEYSSLFAYLTPEILKGTTSKLKKYASMKELSKYSFYLTNVIREKKHQLSEKEEKIVNKLTRNILVPENISNILMNSVTSFGSLVVDGSPTELLNSNYRTIITNKDRETRKKAYDMLTTKLRKYENIYSANLISSMKTTKNLADIYKFKSVLEMDLFGSNIPEKVFINLYETVESRLDVYRKYFAMIKINLGLSSLMYYDKAAEIINSDLTFTPEEAKILITNSLSVLGEEYESLLNEAFDNRWIDFGVYKGKTSSIYATSNYGDNPLILTSYHGKFNDISTLVHELGHAMHFKLSMNNPYHECATALFTAEVASLTNEIIFSNYIIANSNDKDLKLTAIYNILNIVQNNLFDACQEGKLEHIIYKEFENGNEINTDFINDTIYNIRKDYYGNSVILDDNVSSMWTRRMHYFRPYYLFKYATGISSAIYISKKIISDDDDMKIKYLHFLTKGGSNYPNELLLEMGVDLTKPKVINEAIDYMDYLIDEFNRISEEE